MADWKGKKVVVLGLGRQGTSLARYLAGKGAQIVVSDIRKAEELREARESLADLPITYVFEGHPESLLAGADLLCLSGGVAADLPLAQQARRRGIRVTNDSEIFLEFCPAATVGITGSAGKTTVTTLVGRIAARAFAGGERRVWVGGNIGRPLLEDSSEIAAEDLVVMELSSFQLELMTRSTHVAALLNLAPNHLDRHKTFEAYKSAKAKILLNQSEGDIAVLAQDDPVVWGLRDQVRGDLITFGWTPPAEGRGVFISEQAFWLQEDQDIRRICGVSDFSLRGDHNLMNAAAAFAISSAIDLSPGSMAEGVRGFEGVPHRLEFVRRVGEVDWYNDSIATSPDRALAAIRSFDEPLVLLAGGRDKDLPWGEFVQEVRRRVDHLILFGEARGVIRRALKGVPEGDRPLSMESVEGLDQAVEAAFRVAQPGSVVLLAPGGTSFDEFLDFAERGERFKQLVDSL